METAYVQFGIGFIVIIFGIILFLRAEFRTQKWNLFGICMIGMGMILIFSAIDKMRHDEDHDSQGSVSNSGHFNIRSLNFSTQVDSLGTGTVLQAPTNVWARLGIGVVTITRSHEKYQLGDRIAFMSQALAVGDYVEVRRYTITSKSAPSFERVMTIADPVTNATVLANP